MSNTKKLTPVRPLTKKYTAVKSPANTNPPLDTTLIIDNVPQYIFWKDTNSVFIGCNKRFAEIAGLSSPEEIIGKTDFDLANYDKAQKFVDLDKIVINEDKSILNLIEQHKNAQGNEMWISINKIPIRNAKGEIVGILGTFEDITERKKMEVKIQKSEEKYRSLIELTDTAFVILDSKLQITDANETFMRLLAVPSLNFIIGTCLRSWVLAKDIEKFDESFKQIFKKGHIKDLEINLVGEKGTNIYVGLNANLVENGKTVIFCLAVDRSSKKMAMTQQYIKNEKKKDKLIQCLKEIKDSLGIEHNK